MWWACKYGVNGSKYLYPVSSRYAEGKHNFYCWHCSASYVYKKNIYVLYEIRKIINKDYDYERIAVK
jgi:hypothetical protein